jgi:hypothetical protein
VIMARYARERFVVRWNRVTIRACRPSSRRMVAPRTNREKRIMIPRRRRPCGGAVACLTVRGKTCRSVVGIGGVAVILLMAPQTRRRCSRIHAIQVAQRARCRHVGSRQREVSVAVVECRWFPGCRGVANCAIH